MGETQDKFRAVLAHCKAVGDLVECYVETDVSDFPVCQCGFVESVNDLQLSLCLLNGYGEPDGIINVRLDEIVRLQVGGKLLDNIRILYENRGKVFTEELLPSQDHGLADPLDAMNYARENRLLVSILDDYKGRTAGFVTEVGSDWVQIEQILPDGQSNGFALVRTEDIARLDIGGKQEQSTNFIHQAKLGR